MLTIETALDVPCPVLTLAGELDVHTSPALQESLSDVIEAGHSRLVIDLADVPFVDSTGLGTMIGAVKRVAPRGGAVTLARPQPRVARTLDLAGVTGLLTVHETVDLAILKAVAVPAAWFDETRSAAETEQLAGLVTALAVAQELLQEALHARDLGQVEELELDFASAALHVCSELESLGRPEPEGLRSRAEAIVLRRERQH